MSSGGLRFEWILLGMGVVLTLVVAGFFLFVLTRKDDKDVDG